jgi:hypothetical protein
MSCQKCNNERIVSIQGHCVDRFFATLGHKEYGPDYVPDGLGIGRGDDIEIDYCLDCGQIQGEFPIYPECFNDEDDEE